MTTSARQARAPLISVVLCTFNGGRFLAEQLDSVLGQTLNDIEVVASDDGSSDNSVAILRRYAAADSRIRIIEHKTNIGLDRNFASALLHSRGELLAPCDQDDVWLPEKLETLAAAIGEHSMVYCDSTLIDESGLAIGYCMSNVLPMMRFEDPTPFAFGNCVSGHAMLFRRRVLERGLPIAPGFFFDWWLAAVAASMGGVEFCDRALVRYRQHGANVTAARFSQMAQKAGLAQMVSKDESTAGSARSQPRRRGYKLQYLQETEQRLAGLSQLPSQHQPALRELHRLWRARESQWFSPRLWRLMADNKDHYLALTKMSQRERSRYCADLFWGVRMKRFTRKNAYTTSV